jgi:hypothetical protein
MAELEAITETLRRQREDLEDLRDTTLSRSGATAELLEQITDLRRRVEETQGRLAASLRKDESRRNP